MDENSQKNKIFEVLLEELKARHAEINMLNQQVGAIYRLAVTVIGAASAAVSIQSISTGVITLDVVDESHRVVSALFGLLFVALLLLKNQFNSRIATQADYISSVLRPRISLFTGVPETEFLTYEDFARLVRLKKLRSRVTLRAFLFENAIIGIPMLATIGFSLFGAAIQFRWLEAACYLILSLLGTFAWNASGGFWLTLDEVVLEERPNKSSKSDAEGAAS